MRNKKSIILAIVSLLLAMTLMVTMAGCSVKIKTADALNLIKDAIAKSEEQGTYFVKENRYGTRQANDTTEYRFNMIGDDKDTELNDAKANFSIAYNTAISLSVLEYSQWTYGPSLSKDIKPKKAQASDYKHLLFEVKKDTMTWKNYSMEEYLLIPELVNYQIDNVLNSLQMLTVDDLENITAERKGQVSKVTFNVKKEGHPYNGQKIGVQVLYGKISTIEEIVPAGKTAKFKIDITYQGPKINIPHWDGKYSDKPITEAK